MSPREIRSRPPVRAASSLERNSDDWQIIGPEAAEAHIDGGTW